MTLQMVVPFDYTKTVVTRTVSRTTTRKSPVLGLIDNGKFRAKDLLVALGGALVENNDVSSPFVYTKSAPVPLTPEEVGAVLDRAEAVIVGVGDCG